MGLEIGKLILAFMVLINPFGALSIYLDLTRNLSTRERRKVAQLASLTVLIVITAFTLTGGVILKLLGISVGSFQVGGGILVLLIAISMMNGGNNPAKPDVGTEESNDITIQPKQMQNIAAIAVVPLAIPMMIGPGGISTVIIYASAAKGYWDILSILAAGLIISLICFTVLMAAISVSKWLGDTGLTILNRIMGMLLAAVSIEIIVAGVKGLFPQLVG
ncbi:MULTISPECIES: MarC family protein [unclassified Neisseria]|uniref:MarC family protein n=1 Tax=unclassified Neisseria TaxID=2623750 RepID=UPI002665FCF1|nr:MULTISPECIES: MarC family protein [unclassified Neisseria]MDO1509327.1 MarC family protein [Neisseria sp. MVDL19-042950]MDO1515394.1 MarC family protein [Neisseria sp. MVDL18-041461]MDO1562754.1 MarC family protein [Neisseria sp. MVDL20-010259]